MRDAIVAEAHTWLGTPFQDKQHAKHAGVDCVGLVLGIAAALAIPMPLVPDYSPQWHLHQHVEKLVLTMEAVGLRRRPVASRQPGDILVFRLQSTMPCSHLGVLVDPGRMIHAAVSRELSRGRVTYAKLRGLWLEQLTHVFLFPGVQL